MSSARLLQEVIRPTTVVEAPRLSARLGVQLTIASETFQFTGSLKFRAAYNLASKVNQLILREAEWVLQSNLAAREIRSADDTEVA